jgi:DNA repair exonuclease SbcCD ATPase subunit
MPKIFLHFAGYVIWIPRRETRVSATLETWRQVMKKARLITILIPLVLFAIALNCLARDLGSEVATLEQKASRLHNQIDQAKAANTAAMNQQIQAIQNSLNVLIQQRVAIDAQIARMEGQMNEIKTKSQANLNRQIGQYNTELQRTRSEISNALAKKPKQAVQVQNKARAKVKNQLGGRLGKNTLAPLLPPTGKANPAGAK